MDNVKLADIGQYELEVVLRKKSTKEVIFKGKVVNYSQHRPVYGCKNHGDTQYKVMLPGAYSTMQLTIESSKGVDGYRDAVKQYDIVEPIG